MVIASDQTWKQEIEAEIIEDFNNLATAFEENLDIGNAYKDAFTEAIAMIKSLHKQLNDLSSTNSTTTLSVTSTVGMSNPTSSSVKKNYKLDSNKVLCRDAC